MSYYYYYGIPINAILKVGYLPFCDPILSNHCAIYVDLDASILFGTQLPDLTRSTFHHFNTDNREQMNRYLDEVQRHYKNNDLLTKVKQLRNRILASDGSNNDSLIAMCKNLEKKARELMFAAEKKLYKGKYKVTHWSLRPLAASAERYLLLKKQKRYMLCEGEYTSDELEELDEKVYEALLKLKECQQKSRQLRDEQLDYNAQEKAGDWKITKEQAKKVIKNAEKSQSMFRKLKSCIKPSESSSLKHLLVPRPCIEPTKSSHDEDDPSHRWASVIDSDQVFELVLKKMHKVS